MGLMSGEQAANRFGRNPLRFARVQWEAGRRSLRIIRRLGYLGAGFAAAMVFLGLSVAAFSARKHFDEPVAAT
jgi:hypothetical protein